VIEGITGKVRLARVGASCGNSNAEQIEFLNPPMQLESSEATLNVHTVQAASVAFSPVQSLAAADAYILERLDGGCSLSATRPAHLRVVHGDNVTTYRLDRRLSFYENTMSNPCAAPAAYDGAVDEGCASAARSHLNVNRCTRSTAVGPPRFRSLLFILNETTLRAYYERAGTLAYRVQGLRLETSRYAVSPCEEGITRWWRVAPTPCAQSAEAGADTALDEYTRAAIAAAMNASGDVNEFLRDIDVRGTIAATEQGACSISHNGVQAMGAQLTIGGACWRHVPNEEGNVYSFSYWASDHDGNDQFIAAQNPILKWAQAGLTYITYPRGHTMNARWETKVTKYAAIDSSVDGRYIQFIGRYGDVVDFATLRPYAQAREMAEFLGAVEEPRTGILACGSPFEVSSDPRFGHRYRAFLSSEEYGREDLYMISGNEAKQVVWTTVAFSAPDQLRQRVAFALSQILVLGEEGVGKTDEQEVWLAYYDIFVRHAFGTYRDIMWEVSYSPMVFVPGSNPRRLWCGCCLDAAAAVLTGCGFERAHVQMSTYLTYHGNRALHVAGTNPDESPRLVIELTT
jgi:cullin-associated NEDD8-dissociated protein 1